MKNVDKSILIYVFFVSILLFTGIYLFFQYRDRNIIISGKVVYDEFKKGDIELYWTTKLNYAGPPAPQIHGLTYLSMPGSYRFRVPKNYRNIYICARNRGSLYESFAYFISEPIKIGSQDIRGLDLVLKTKRFLMNDYKGPIVKLSGRVLFDRYKNGVIVVAVYSPDYFKKIRLPPDIAKVILIKPGNFNIELPSDIGKVYIIAINIPVGERSGNSPVCSRAGYIDNPILIGNKNISGIGININ